MSRVRDLGVLVLMIVGCTGGEAVTVVKPAEPAKVEVAKVEPAAPTVVEAAKVEAPAQPVPARPLVTGPERYELPLTYRVCSQSEIFCGVHIVDLASKQVTTLITRDQGASWAVRANKKETPVPVTLVAVPPEPRAIWRTTNLFPGPEPVVATATVPATGLELWHDVAAVAGDKTYAIARKDSAEKIFLYAIEADGKHLPLTFSKKGGWPQLVYPYREGIAIYMGARQDSLDLYDPAKGEVYERIPIVSDVDKECSKLATETEPDRLLILPEQGRAYVQFECVAIGA